MCVLLLHNTSHPCVYFYCIIRPIQVCRAACDSGACTGGLLRAGPGSARVRVLYGAYMGRAPRRRFQEGPYETRQGWLRAGLSWIQSADSRYAIG